MSDVCIAFACYIFACIGPSERLRGSRKLQNEEKIALRGSRRGYCSFFVVLKHEWEWKTQIWGSLRTRNREWMTIDGPTEWVWWARTESEKNQACGSAKCRGFSSAVSQGPAERDLFFILKRYASSQSFQRPNIWRNVTEKCNTNVTHSFFKSCIVIRVSIPHRFSKRLPFALHLLIGTPSPHTSSERRPW